MIEQGTEDYLRINEIKNYLYCPRIAYYTLCLRLDLQTDLSRLGTEAEAKTKKQMKRRQQALHSVHQGERLFDVQVMSRTYRLIGRVDEVVQTAEGDYVVDYKDSQQDYGYWKMQLCAYSLAYAEQTGRKVLAAYVYSIPEQKYQLVKWSKVDQTKLFRLRDEVLALVETERCPPPVEQVGKCRVCQYLRFCNDIF
jgi:CRISPR-associated exonuclease Cas4